MQASEKDLVFVFGPESSGTRLMTRIFLRNGYWGSDGHQQPHVTSIPINEEKIVIRRSVPHGNDWNAFADQYEKALDLQYDPWVVVTVRSCMFAAPSAVKAEHVKDTGEAYKEQARALSFIYPVIRHDRVLTVTYESLITDPQGVADGLGLESIPLEVRNENKKHYL